MAIQTTNPQELFQVERVIPWVSPYEYLLSTNQGDFIYVPQNIINKGYVKEENAGFAQKPDGTIEVVKEKRQFFHPEFLDQNFLNTGRSIEIDPATFTDAQKSAMSELAGENITKGFLFPAVEYMGRVSSTPFSYELDEDSPPISGISSLSNEGVGGTSFDAGYKYILGEPKSNNFDFINPDASINTLTTTYTPAKKRGGILGSAARSITNFIASIPYAPEIAAFATGNPVLYGSLKAAQTAAAGGDIGDVIKSGVVSGGTMYAGQQLLGPADAGATPESVGGTPGVSEVYPVDMSVGGTVTPLPPGSIGLPPIDLLGETTFPSQGLSPPTGNEVIQAPGAPTPDVSLISPEAVFPGEGLINPTMPGVPSLGGGQGVTVGVPGGTVGQGGFTPTEAVPVLGDPGSFINDPNVLGQPVIEPIPEGISLRDAFDAARGINRVAGLLGGGQQTTGGGSDPGQQGIAGSVDVSQLLALLGGARARTPSIYSLLG
jgi:hypothetical protein